MPDTPHRFDIVPSIVTQLTHDALTTYRQDTDAVPAAVQTTLETTPLLATCTPTQQAYLLARLDEEYGVDDTYLTEADAVRRPTTWRDLVAQLTHDGLYTVVHREVVAELPAKDSSPFAGAEPRQFPSSLTDPSIEPLRFVERLASCATQAQCEDESLTDWEARSHALETYREELDALSPVELVWFLEATGDEYDITDVQETDQFPDVASLPWPALLRTGVVWHHADRAIQCERE